MNSNEMGRPTTGRVVGESLLAGLLGGLLPLLMLTEVLSLCPVLFLGGIFLVFFQCSAGWIPAALFIGAQLGSTAMLCGFTIMAMELVAAVLPGLAVVRGVARRQPFFEQLRLSLVYYGAGVVAAIVIAYMSYGSGMVQKFMDVMRTQFRRMPDAALQPLVEAVNSALSTQGLQGLTRITIADYRSSLMGVLDLMEQTYGQMLPGALLSGALVSAVLSALWGNWRMARRGLATSESFKGMTEWHLPGQVTAGTLLLWLVSVLLAQGNIAAGQAVSATVQQIACFTFVFQALAAMDRRYFERGMALKTRRVLIGISLAFSLIFRDIATLLMIVGILSALMGREGLIRRHMNRDDHDDSDQDDPDK